MEYDVIIPDTGDVFEEYLKGNEAVCEFLEVVQKSQFVCIWF